MTNPRYPFPFVGAGEAEYFEWAAVQVRFTREPTKTELTRVKKGVPPPLADGFELNGADLSVASDQHAHVHIAQAYGDGELESFERMPFAKDADVTRFNIDIERWLREAHAICPILVAYRAEDGEAGGTELSAWHDDSLQRVPEVLAALDESDARLAAAITTYARAAGVRLPGDGPEPKHLAKALDALDDSDGRTLRAALAAEPVMSIGIQLALVARAGWHDDRRKLLLSVSDLLLADERVAADELVVLLVSLATPSAALAAAARRVVKANVRFGTDLATQAYNLAIGGDVLRGRALFDIALENAELPLPTYCNALYTLKFVDGDDRRALRPLYQRFLARCLPFGAKNPAIHINAAGVRLVMDDRDEDGALSELERAHALDAPELMSARAAPDFKRFHGNPRFEALFSKPAQKKVTVKKVTQKKVTQKKVTQKKVTQKKAAKKKR